MSTKKRTKLDKFLGKLKFVLLLLGILFLAAGFSLRDDSSKLSFNSDILASPNASVPVSSSPVSIQIPTLKLNLPIEETEIINNTWQISETAASHLNTSAKPGEKGADIIYSHNTPERFKPILKISNLDLIKITTADSLNYYYQVTSTQTVNPDQVEVLNAFDEEILILYTCTGFLDSRRFVVKASRVI